MTDLVGHRLDEERFSRVVTFFSALVDCSNLDVIARVWLQTGQRALRAEERVVVKVINCVHMVPENLGLLLGVSNFHYPTVYLVGADRNVVVARGLPRDGNRGVHCLIDKNGCDLVGPVLERFLGRLFKLLLVDCKPGRFSFLRFLSFNSGSYLLLGKFDFLGFHLDVFLLIGKVFIAFEHRMSRWLRLDFGLYRFGLDWLWLHLLFWLGLLLHLRISSRFLAFLLLFRLWCRRIFSSRFNLSFSLFWSRLVRFHLWGAAEETRRLQLGHLCLEKWLEVVHEFF